MANIIKIVNGIVIERETVVIPKKLLNSVKWKAPVIIIDTIAKTWPPILEAP